MPETKIISICVNDIGKRLEFVPLLLVMRIFELSRISPFSRGFNFYETDEGLMDRNRVIGASLELSQKGFTDKSYSVRWEVAETSDIGEQLL